MVVANFLGLLHSSRCIPAKAKVRSADNVYVNSTLREIATGLTAGTAITVVLMAPVIIAMIRMANLRRAYDAAGELPFTELPLRPPGESLRLKIEKLSESLDEFLFTRAFFGLAGTIMVFAATGSYKIWVLVGLIIIVAIDCARAVPGVLRTLKERWNARLGFMGERVVGEHLNQLLSSGYHVFHDIPFENYNIDHVIVGPTGVFAVETKTRRKPKENGKKVDYRVHFDGEALQWPRWKDTGPIDQASRNARSLAQWLSSATGESVRAQGIVTIPGWWIDDSTQHPVWVLNPKRIKPFVEAREVCALSTTRIQAIAHQLTDRCRLKKD